MRSPTRLRTIPYPLSPSPRMNAGGPAATARLPQLRPASFPGHIDDHSGTDQRQLGMLATMDDVYYVKPAASEPRFFLERGLAILDRLQRKFRTVEDAPVHLLPQPADESSRPGARKQELRSH